MDIFARAVKKYIGAYTALLGGLDMLVFTATIGERSSFMRAKICADLKHLGIVNPQGGPVSIVVLSASEMKEMAGQLQSAQLTTL